MKRHQEKFKLRRLDTRKNFTIRKQTAKKQHQGETNMSVTHILFSLPLMIYYNSCADNFLTVIMPLPHSTLHYHPSQVYYRLMLRDLVSPVRIP